MKQGRGEREKSLMGRAEDGLRMVSGRLARSFVLRTGIKEDEIKKLTETPKQ